MGNFNFKSGGGDRLVGGGIFPRPDGSYNPGAQQHYIKILPVRFVGYVM